eukprot:sb/3466152/
MDLSLSLTQRIPLIIYDTLATLLMFTGNSAVLYTSLRYNAISLDEVSLVFVQNLAIADLLFAVTVIFPILVTLVADRFVLGGVWCFINSQTSFIPWILNSLLVLAISSHRVAVATNPLLSLKLNQSQARYLCLVLWCLALSVPGIQIVSGSVSSFSPTTAKCVSSIYSDAATADLFLWYIVVILSLTPLCLVIILNGVLGFIAVRASKSMRARSHYKGVVMVCALSGLFAVSWLPWGISTILSLIGRPINYPYISLLGYHITFLNGMGNPILYTLTNRRFARFLRQLLSVKVSEWTKWQSTTTTTGGNTNNTTEQNTNQRQLPASCKREDIVVVNAEGEPCSIELRAESESEV